MFTRHTVTIIGLVLGVVGSLLLSYDLLGKPGGLARRLLVASMSGTLGALLAFGLIATGFLDALTKFNANAVHIGVQLQTFPRAYFVLVFALMVFLLSWFTAGYVIDEKRFLAFNEHVPDNDIATSGGEQVAPEEAAVSGMRANIDIRVRLRDWALNALLLILLGLMFAVFRDYWRAFADFVAANLGSLVIYMICGITGMLAISIGVPRIALWVNSWPDRRLGSIGAFLTLLAFAVQLTLEVMSSQQP